MKICIDAGHGGKDSGAVGLKGRMEKNDTLKLALALEKEMKKRGHQTIMTRIGDVYCELEERAKIANNNKVNVFISLHRNSYSDINASGGEVLYGTNASKTSVKLAELVNSKMNSAAGFRNRGAKRQAATVLNSTNMPAVTIEAGFITNSGDNTKFDSKFDAIVDAIADSCEQIFGAGQPVEEKIENPLAYELAKDCPLWRYVGEGKQGTKVILEAYPIQQDPDGNFARINDGNGNVYLCEWANLKKS